MRFIPFQYSRFSFGCKLRLFAGGTPEHPASGLRLCGRIVLACATYDGFLFPPMENLLTHLKTKSFQNRTVGLMENGTWAPMAAKLMRAELESMKNIAVCDTVVTIRSAANAAAEAQMDALAAEIVAK